MMDMNERQHQAERASRRRARRSTRIDGYVFGGFGLLALLPSTVCVLLVLLTGDHEHLITFLGVGVAGAAYTIGGLFYIFNKPKGYWFIQLTNLALASWMMFYAKKFEFPLFAVIIGSAILAQNARWQLLDPRR